MNIFFRQLMVLFIAFQFSNAQISITNLYDAFGKDNPKLIQSFGFSCLIKYQGRILLFDAGSNADVFKNNILALKVDLSELDAIVVSHSHFDHLNGIDYVLTQNPGVKIYFPYDVFWGADVPFDATGQDPLVKDSLPGEMKYFNNGSTKFSIKQTGRFWKSNIEFINASTEIFPGIKLIKTISPYMGYFNKYPNLSFVPGVFKNNPQGKSESGLVELSLSLNTSGGELLVVGCSHTGIDKIAYEAKSFTQKPLHLIYGGFHLLPYNRTEMSQLVSYLKDDIKVSKVAPAHCSGHLAFKMFRDVFVNDFLFAGLGETIQLDE